MTRRRLVIAAAGAMTFHLLINLKSAKALGIAVPQSLLMCVRTRWFGE